MKKGLIATALALGLVGASAPPITADNTYHGCPFSANIDRNVVIDAATYPHPVCGVNGVIDGSVRADGVHLTVQGTISGDLTVNDGNLLLFGPVAGRVRQTGTGYVDVYEPGVVAGSISESGPGRVGIRETTTGGPGGIVRGRVTEKDAGDISVRGTAYRGVSEQGSGSVFVRAGATVEGAIKEKGEGSCLVSPDASVTGPLRGDCRE